MWTVGKSAILLLLFICTIIDLRKRTLPISLLLAGSIVILLTSLWKYEFDFFTMLKGMIPGILLGTISKITREAVGYGDVWIIYCLEVTWASGILWLLCVARFFYAVLWQQVVWSGESLEEIQEFHSCHLLQLHMWG